MKKQLKFLENDEMKQKFTIKSCTNKKGTKSLLVISKESGRTISLSKNYIDKIFENEGNVKVEKVQELVTEVKDML
jgi:hypothetical protein